MINFANDLIFDMEYDEIVNAFKAHHKIMNGSIGEQWYQGFMKRHDAILKYDWTKVSDIRYHSWVIKEHFKQCKTISMRQWWMLV